jgi:hypothetical protein
MRGQVQTLESEKKDYDERLMEIFRLLALTRRIFEFKRSKLSLI